LVVVTTTDANNGLWFCARLVVFWTCGGHPHSALFKYFLV
jgi:hypothetical protein